MITWISKNANQTDYQISTTAPWKQMMGIVTKQIGRSIWQKLFHDHVIHGEQDYLKVWEYIDGNPAKWKEDCFYKE